VIDVDQPSALPARPLSANDVKISEIILHVFIYGNIIQLMFRSRQLSLVAPL